MSESPEIFKLIRMMEKYKASDLHLKHNRPPIYRIHGQPVVIEQIPPLSGEKIKSLMFDIAPQEQKEKFNREGNAEFTASIQKSGRFRINVFSQRGEMSVVMRRVSDEIPTLKSLNLPKSVEKIATLNEGLVLVAGVTGSGKSTTLASLIERINISRRCHIITIEDPIEYNFVDKQSFINQREVGTDLKNFGEAIRYILRQDPDVIMLGELRDQESFETALTAAETGHLVFGTIHAGTAAQVISRILDLFPVERHGQLRQLLFFNLKGILCQRLLKGATKEAPRVPAAELMYCNPSIQEAILKGKEETVTELIKRSRADGMIDFNSSLFELTQKGLVTEEEAMAYSPNREAFEMQLKGIKVSSV